jgi:methylmalonyl-CoA/ethylmalonyl-CoA epimerase
MAASMSAKNPSGAAGGARHEVTGVQHIAVAVPSLDAALPVYRDLFGFELHAIEEVEDQRVRVAVLLKGGHRIELVEPASAESPVSKFLEKRGPGLHHVCLDVVNLDAMLAALKDSGVPLIDERGRPGAEGRRVAFVHPKGTGGVLIELSEAGGVQPAPAKPAREHPPKPPPAPSPS